MKRNRSRYVIYMEPWSPGKHKVVYSKGQMKKVLMRCNSGSRAIKNRLIHYRNGSFDFWNVDQDYLLWVKD